MRPIRRAAFVCALLAGPMLSYSPAYASENVTSVQLKQLIQATYSKEVGELKLTSQSNAYYTFESDDYEVVANPSGNQVKFILSKKDNLKLTNESLNSNKFKVSDDNTALLLSQGFKLESQVKFGKQVRFIGKTDYTLTQGENFTPSLQAVNAHGESLDIRYVGQVDTQTPGTYNIQAIAKNEKQTITVTVQDDSAFYDKIAQAAIAQVGTNQDCTMLVTNALKAVGIDFHGWPEEYASLGEWTDNPVPGDICIYAGHVALYIGNNQAVHGGWLGNQTVISSVQCTNAFYGYIHVRR